MVSQAFYGWLKEERGYYLLWRTSVKKIDNSTCLISGATKNIHVHHIYCRKNYKELQFEVANGICLEKKIHKEFHSKYGHCASKQNLLEFALSKGVNLSERLKNCPDNPNGFNISKNKKA